MRAADAHWARFGDACLQEGADAAELGHFREVVAHAVPATGRWFPRVQLTARGLGVLIRPAPPPQSEARVVVADGDPRTQPQRKGPDLETLIALRERGRAEGADEVLLCDPATGALREGALSSLLWWEDNALCTTPDEHTLPGVTRALLLARARERGIELRVRSPLPAELAGREVWLTSALHGIRAVSGWLRPAQPAGEPRRAAAWRAAL